MSRGTVAAARPLISGGGIGLRWQRRGTAACGLGRGRGGGCAEGERGAGGAGGRGLAVRSPQGAGVDEGVLRPVGRPLRVSLVPL